MRDVLRINSGEIIGLKVLKIKSIPHISILTDDLSPEGQTQTIVNTANNMVGLLNEVYQLYKEWYSRHFVNPDISLDITWLTSPVENQPFKANIDIFLVIRAINRDQETVKQWISDVTTLVTNALSIDKYDYCDCELDNYFTQLARCNSGKVHTIVKEEHLEDLQN